LAKPGIQERKIQSLEVYSSGSSLPAEWDLNSWMVGLPWKIPKKKMDDNWG